nr:hypothetical protein GCM10020093_096120 [Planobispora longispora]
MAATTADLPRAPDLRPHDPALLRLVSRLARENGPLDAFEFLCARYVEVHSRQLSVTRDDVAALMTRLAGGGAVLDPACGVGTLLLGANTPLGQELSETNALLTAVRLLLRGAPPGSWPETRSVRTAWPAPSPTRCSATRRSTSGPGATTS